MRVTPNTGASLQLRSAVTSRRAWALVGMTSMSLLYFTLAITGCRVSAGYTPRRRLAIEWPHYEGRYCAWRRVGAPGGYPAVRSGL